MSPSGHRTHSPELLLYPRVSATRFFSLVSSLGYIQMEDIHVHTPAVQSVILQLH
jgi:hypothetical protein